jgi:hypothetical protein
MPTQARVSSVDALDTFRSSLILYIERARHVLDDLQHDVVRTRDWLEHDRQTHWKKQVRLRGHELAQAEQELLTAKFSEHSEAVRDRRQNVDRARTRLSDAENALQRTQRWFRQFDHELDPRVRTTRPLRQMLDHELIKAVALLADTISTLAAYADLAPGRAGNSAGQPAAEPADSPDQALNPRPQGGAA